VDISFFSLDTALGTARAIAYWDKLSDQQKTDILFSAPFINPPLLDMLLKEGNALLVEIAFNKFRGESWHSPPAGGEAELVSVVESFLIEHWKSSLGFSQWDVKRLPINLGTDFYAWVRRETTDGPCADLEAWSINFFDRAQLERGVIIESGKCNAFWGAVGLLAVGVAEGKLSCSEAYELFRSAISSKSIPKDEDWNITWNDAFALAALLSAMAIVDVARDETWTRMARVIRLLPNLTVDEDSVEPILAMHHRALTLLILLNDGSGLQLVREKLIKSALAGDGNPCPPDVRFAILRSKNGWCELAKHSPNRIAVLSFAVGAGGPSWQDWGLRPPLEDRWLLCGLGVFTVNDQEMWRAHVANIKDRTQRKTELAEMACLCEALIASGAGGYIYERYKECDFARSTYNYEDDQAVIPGDIILTFENLMRRDPFGRRTDQWRGWRAHMEKKYQLREWLRSVVIPSGNMASLTSR